MEVHSSMVGIVFWVAIAAIVFINVWGKRSAERERQLTLRTAIERGQQIDPAMIEKIMAGQQKPKQSQFGLLIGGVVVSFAGVGILLMGLILGAEDPEALKALVGSGVLVGMVGVGLFVAHVLQRRLQAAAPPPTDPAA
ncbi:MAG: DUF6249 domain-containing protein [Proteobacteria bacterium]|nr:DUF6249 domain-containing protein [Pseudomonadota bacterium]